MTALLQDIKYGARLLVKAPGFSLVVIITLALAIGANTMIFSFVNVLVLRPMPLEDMDTLTVIVSLDPQRGNDRARVSAPDFIDQRDSTRSFAALAAVSQGTMTMSGQGDPRRVAVTRVTSKLHDIWGTPFVAGRGFRPGEDSAGAAPVVVLSHRFWMRQFGGRPVVGTTIVLDGRGHTVVGVLSPSIEIGNLTTIDLWTPLVLDSSTGRRDERLLQVWARLAPGVSVAQANAEVQGVARRLQQEHPQTNNGWDARVLPSGEVIVGGDTWLVLGLLGVVVSFVLLIASANLANLMLARSIERRKEIALRAALGASRLRVVRQLVTESLMLGILGGAAGLLLAYGGMRLMRAIAYEPFFEMVTIDRNVLLFNTAISLITPILFALLPALHSTRAALNDALKDGAGRTSGGARVRRSRAVLVVAQLGLASMLLVVAGLVIQTMIAITRVDLGFNPHSMLTFRADLPEWKYKGNAEMVQFYERAAARLGALPATRAVSLVSQLPVLGRESKSLIGIEGRVAQTPKDQPWAVVLAASDHHFSAAAVPVLQGRSFTASDTIDSPPVAIVSQEMARRHWRGLDQALGARIRVGAGESPGAWLTVVGIVGNVRGQDVTKAPNPQVYTPIAQDPRRTVAFMIRTEDPDTLASAVRGAIREVDPDLAVYELQTLDTAFDQAQSSDRIMMGLFISFAVVAVVLAAAGLYGVIAYSVSQRTQEIGIRMALGAVPRDVRTLIVGQALRLIAAGAVIGLVGGFGIARVMGTLLYGVGPADPVTYGGVVLLLGSVAMAATYIPARRAMRVDPIRALRMD